MRMSKVVDSSQVDPNSIDLLNPGFYGEGDPHLVWDAMRKRDPIHWQNVEGKDGFWSVTKYEDSLRVLKDHNDFTSTRGTLLSILGVEDPAGEKQMAVTDPPKHAILRVPLQKALNPREIEKHIPRIRNEIRKLLLPMALGEPIDLATSMASISTAAAGLILNLPSEDWPLLTRLTNASIAPDDPEYLLPAGPEETMKRAHRELFAYFHDVVSDRRKSPKEDIVSILLDIEMDGERLTQGNIVSNLYSLLLGANVTTPHVPTASFLELIENDLYEDWMLNFSEYAQSGLDEALRWSSPASHFMRYAKNDVVLRGKQIKKGDAVVVWIGSANRDEDIFSNPYQFDIRRKPNKHISFGFGPHHCVGHFAAKQTLGILFEEVFTNFESIKLAATPEHLSSNFIAGIKHMQILAHPKKCAEMTLSEITLSEVN